MSKTDYYTIKSDPQDSNHFTVIAVDADYEKVKQYEIHGSSCECWAGQKWCRHKQMLVMFKKDNLLNSNRFWNHDKQKWLPQAKGAEQ